MFLIYLITGLAMGVIFGFALEKGRVFEPGVIVGQFQLRNWILVKMFVTAIVTTLIIIMVLHSTGIISLSPKAFVFPGSVAGGLIFGAGMAISGA
ncbi:MAG: YeeE/YedE thiosulfate transporter family protein [Desulfovibrionales bacterium]